MRNKICVIGKGVKLAHDFADVVDDVHGADIVIVEEEADLEQIRDSAPAAVLLLLGGADACEKAYETTLFPRSRIIGIEGRVEDAVESILFERNDEHDVIAMMDGGEFGPRRARLGLRGITALGER